MFINAVILAVSIQMTNGSSEMRIAEKFLQGPFWFPRKNLSRSQQQSLFRRFDIIEKEPARVIERGIGLALEKVYDSGDPDLVWGLDWNINIFAHYMFQVKEKNSALGYAGGKYFLRDYPYDTTSTGSHGFRLFLDLEKKYYGRSAD